MATRGPLVLLGAGEHAVVVLDAAVAAGWTPIGYSAPEAALGGPIAALRWLGPDNELPGFLDRASATPAAPEGRPWLVLAFGGIVPDDRRAAIARHLDREDAPPAWATVIHPSAIVATSARVEPGAVVLASVVVGPGATIGTHAIVNTGAIVEHDVEIGPFARVGPGAVIGGAASIGPGAVIGLGALVRDHRTIGPGAMVAMGAVVIDDVEPGALVMGIPAQAAEWSS